MAASTVRDCKDNRELRPGRRYVQSSYSATCPTDPQNGSIDGGAWVPRPAVISDYAELKSAGFQGRQPLEASIRGTRRSVESRQCFLCSRRDQLPDANRCAFAGINPNVGGNQMLFPIGRSVYNGLQTSLKQDVRNPFKGVRYVNLQVSYALSRYISQAQDGDFVNSAWNYCEPQPVHWPERVGSHPPDFLRRYHGVPCAFPRQRDRAFL